MCKFPCYVISGLKALSLVGDAVVHPSLLRIITLQGLFLVSVSRLDTGQHLVHALNLRGESLAQAVHFGIGRLQFLQRLLHAVDFIAGDTSAHAAEVLAQPLYQMAALLDLKFNCL